jgi:uncharacterized membrane protein
MSRWLYVSLTLTAVALAASLYVYADRANLLEAEVPTHWDLHDNPNVFTPRDEILPQLLMLPGVMAVVVVLTVVLPWISPKHFSVDEFRGTFNYLMMLVAGLMGYLQAVMLTTMVHPDLVRNGTLQTSRLILAGIFPFFALLGNQLGKVRRNFWLGVRTPWTLASEAVWTQTHRVAAWTFVAAGVIGFIAAVADVPLIVCVGIFLVAAVTPVVYSLFLYKQLEHEGRL